MLSSNTSTISKKILPVNDLKQLNKEKSTKTISPPKDPKYNFNQKHSYSKMRRDSMSKLDDKYLNSMRGKIQLNNFESNNVVKAPSLTPVESTRKPGDLKQALKIKNFFESTKMNTIQVKAVTDRFNEGKYSKLK